MARSKIYPWDCWMLTLHFHPFCWSLEFYRNPDAANGRKWCQEHFVVMWWLRFGPFTLAQEWLH